MEAIHQGYLLCSFHNDDSNVGRPPQKVYVVMTNNELICYSENPATQNFAKVNILASYSLRNCTVSDSSSSRNPKSFDVVSNRDQTQLELICPTNSVKFQWVKHLQVQTYVTDSTQFTPAVVENRVNTAFSASNTMNSTGSRGSPVHILSGSGGQPVSKLTASRNLAAKVLTPVPRISYNTNLLDRPSGPGAEPTGGNKFAPEDMPKWIPGNFGNNKHSSLALSPSPPRSRSAGRSHGAAPELKPTSEDPTGFFRPGDSLDSMGTGTGRSAHTATGASVAIRPAPSPAPTAANVSRQRARPAKPSNAPAYDVLAERAAPNRARTAAPAGTPSRGASAGAASQGRRAPSAGNAPTPSRRGASSTYVAHTAPEATAAQSLRHSRALEHSFPAASPAVPEQTDLLSKSLNNMTVAEIRAALLSMPETVRHSLTDVNTPNTTIGSTFADPLPSHHRDGRDRDGGREHRDRHHRDSDERSRNLSQNNSTSMQEYYSSGRRRGKDEERYRHFMDDHYPTVGSFYAEGESGGEGSQYSEGRDEGTEKEGRDETEGSAEGSSSEHDQLGEREDSVAESGEDYSPPEDRRGGQGLRAQPSARDRQRRRGDPEPQSPSEDQYSPDGRSFDHRPATGGRRDSYTRDQEYRTVAEGREAIRRASESYGTEAFDEYLRSDTRQPTYQVQPQRQQQLSGSRRPSSSGSGIPRRVPRDAQVSDAADTDVGDTGGGGRTHFRFSEEEIHRDNRRKSHYEEPESQIDHHDRDQQRRSGKAATDIGRTEQRARSAQRAKASAAPQRGPTEGNGARSASATTSGKGRDSQLRGQRDESRDGRDGRSDSRSRYLTEEERKGAMDWSRRQAWEKNVRGEYTKVPSGGATPLNLKYRSFHNSLEKEKGSGGRGARAGDEARPQSRPKAAQPPSAAAVQEAAARPDRRQGEDQKQAIARSQQGQAAVLGRPESFFQFKNTRFGSNPRNADADKGVTRGREVSPKGQMGGAGHVNGRPAAQPLPVSQQQQPPQRQPQQARRLPQPEHTVTNVAEWRRLTEWLHRIGMQQYIEVLKVNGVTKLSLVELMQPSDMRQIGIAAEDIPVILNNVTEFTNRTRSLSEQVLNTWGESQPSSPTNSYGSAAKIGGLHQRPANVPAPAQPLSVVPNGGRVPTQAAVPAPGQQPTRPGPPTRPLFRAPSMGPGDPISTPSVGPGAPAASAAVTSNAVKPLKPPYSSVYPRHSVPVPSATTTSAGSTTTSAPGRRLPTAIAPPLPGAFVTPRDEDSLRTGPGAVPGTGANDHIFSDFAQINDELFRCFESGERELFFHAWKQAALYMPDDCLSLNPSRPAMFHARQVIEFHLHLHFAVYPITHHQGKKAEKLSKLALQRYLESVMLTSELDALNQDLPADGGSSPSANVHADTDDGALKLNTTTTSFPSPSPSRPFTRSREYAVYAGMVLVPEPEQNVAFQSLFQPDWMASLKERLRQFLQLVRPNVEIVSTVPSSLAGSVEAEAAVGVAQADNAQGTAAQSSIPPMPQAIPQEVARIPAPALPSTHASSAPVPSVPVERVMPEPAPPVILASLPVSSTMVLPTADDHRSVVSAGGGGGGASVKSGREKIKTYLHAKEMATPVAPTGALNDFEISFSSPVAEKESSDAVVPSPLPSAIKAHSVTASPGDAQSGPHTSELPAPAPAAAVPLEMPRPVPVLDLATAAAVVPNPVPARAEETGPYPRISRINSPSSPMSSVISQLTDDSPRLSGHHHPHHPPPPEFALPPAVTASAPALQSSPTSAEKRSKKPFSAEKLRMQSQVDSYNRLLRQSAVRADEGQGPAPAVASSGVANVHEYAPVGGNSATHPSNESTVPQPAPVQGGAISLAQPRAPATAATATRPAVASRRSSTQSAPAGAGAPKLNLGFGMRRKSAADSGPPSISLAAQVAKYNKLLNKGALTASSAAPAVQGPTVAEEPIEESATSPVEPPSVESAEGSGDRVSPAAAAGLGESELSPSQAQRMDEVVLEMQDIYEEPQQRDSEVSGENEARLAVAASMLAE